MIVIVVLFIKHDTLNQIFVIFVNFLICVKYFMNFSVFFKLLIYTLHFTINFSFSELNGSGAE